LRETRKKAEKFSIPTHKSPDGEESECSVY